MTLVCDIPGLNVVPTRLRKPVNSLARNILIQTKFEEPGQLALGFVDKEQMLPSCSFYFILLFLYAIYMLPFTMTKEKKLNTFQYKIIHNILPHAVWLHRMNIADFPASHAS